MKTLYATVILFLATLGVNAQYELNFLIDPIGWPVEYPGSGSLDSIDMQLSQSDSTLSGTWRNDQKFETPKDANGHITLFGSYFWDNTNNVWIPVFESLYEYTYNASNKVTGMTQTQASNGYQIIRYASYTMNGNGYYTEGNYIDSIIVGTTHVFKIAKDEVTYNGSNQITERIYQESNINSSLLENDTRYAFTWASGKLTEILEQDWDGSAWENDSKQTLTYDANGNMLSKVNQYWNGSAWENDEKDEYTYDTQGRLATQTDYTDTSGTWDNEDRITYTYISATSTQIDSWIEEVGNGSTWTNAESYDMFNANNQPSYALGYLWSGSAWESSAKLRILFNDTNASGNTPPNPPSNMMANTSSRSSGSITLTWQDNSNNEDGFYLERGTDGTSFSQIADLGVDVSSYIDTTGLVASTQYFYRVLAYNADGSSSPSNVADATTFPLSIAEHSATAFALYPNPAKDNFQIEVEANCNYRMLNIGGIMVNSGRLQPGVNTVEASNLPAGLYFIEIESATETAMIKMLIQ